MKDHQPGFVPFSDNFGSDQRCEYVATTKERALQSRVYVERAEALGNVSQGWHTGTAAAGELAPVVRAQWAPPAEPASEPAHSAGVSAAEKSAVLDGWIPWNGGGERPAGAVLVRYRDGKECPARDACGIDWERAHRDYQTDIVAYRLAQPAAPAVPVDPYQHLRGKKVQLFLLGKWNPLIEPTFEFPPNLYRIAGEAA